MLLTVSPNFFKYIFQRIIKKCGVQHTTKITWEKIKIIIISFYVKHVTCWLKHTGWQSISEIKYCLTVTSFWVLVTFWAYRRLTRCGPFDKIALWSLLMPIWDHLSLDSKETIFRRCTNFSDFCNFWKSFSDDKSQKIGWQNDSWEWWNVSF